METFSNLLPAFSQQEGSIFYFVLFLSAAAFLIAETAWLARQLKSSSQQKLVKNLPADDARFGIFWTLVPALVLITLVFAPAGLRSKSHSVSSREAKKPSAWSERLRKRWMRENAAVMKEYDR